ncbi:SIS domain-containing protein, partial [Rhizobium ruizarguesonis]
EANHGDLGMIARDDVLLAISKGGESAELKSIISFTRRFSIPLISITCSEGSSLAAAAACTKKAGVPVEANVAASLAPI